MRVTSFWRTVLAIVVGNILTGVVLGLIALVYLSTQIGGDPVITTDRPLSSACLDTLNVNQGQSITLPANCAGDDSKAVAEHATDLGVTITTQEGLS